MPQFRGGDASSVLHHVLHLLHSRCEDIDQASFSVLPHRASCQTLWGHLPTVRRDLALTRVDGLVGTDRLL